MKKIIIDYQNKIMVNGEFNYKVSIEAPNYTNFYYLNNDSIQKLKASNNENKKFIIVEINNSFDSQLSNQACET